METRLDNRMERRQMQSGRLIGPEMHVRGMHVGRSSASEFSS